MIISARRALAVLTALEQSPDPVKHRDALADVVIELTNVGVDYYFMKPLRLAAPGFIVLQSACLGRAAAQQVIGSVIRNVIGWMDGPPLAAWG